MNIQSRAQRLLQFLVTHPGGVSVRQLRDGVAPAASIAHISAQVCQMVAAGKVRRTGQAMHYRFWPTSLSMLDLRSHDRAGKPRRQAKPQPKKPKKPAPPLRIAARPSPPPPNINGAAPETVEQFLARGGRIQYCAPGESSQTRRQADEAFQASCRRGRSKQQAERAKARQADALFEADDTDDELVAA
jgi:type IV secretory pathway VirB10-like protein